MGLKLSSQQEIQTETTQSMAGTTHEMTETPQPHIPPPGVLERFLRLFNSNKFLSTLLLICFLVALSIRSRCKIPAYNGSNPYIELIRFSYIYFVYQQSTFFSFWQNFPGAEISKLLILPLEVFKKVIRLINGKKFISILLLVCTLVTVSIYFGSNAFGEFIVPDYFSNLAYRLLEIFNFRPNHPLIKDPSSSLQPASKAETIQEKTGTFHGMAKTAQLLILPPKVLRRIIQFLGVEEVHSTLPLICSFFRHLCRDAILYEKYAFCGNRTLRSISQFYLEAQTIQEPRYFRSSVDLSMGDVTQPAEMQIHVFTTSYFEKIHLSDVVSMAIELSISNSTSEDVHTKAIGFLAELFGNRLVNLKNLKLSGFQLNTLLRSSWFVLPHLDRLVLACSSLDRSKARPCLRQGFKWLHLKLGENFDLNQFPILPISLEVLSMYFSSLKNEYSLTYITQCRNLRKM
jgi:hypothetical protein